MSSRPPAYYVLIHGRGGSFYGFSDIVRQIGTPETAWVFDWSDGRLLRWESGLAAERAEASRLACVGGSVVWAAKVLAGELECLDERVVLIGHSKGGAVALQLLVDVSLSARKPNLAAVLTLDPAVSAAAQGGIWMESRAKRAADIIARAPLLGIPAAWYSRVVLEYDQLDVGPLRRSIGRVAKAGVPVINVMARAGWGMRVPGARNIRRGLGGHRSVLHGKVVEGLLEDLKPDPVESG